MIRTLFSRKRYFNARNNKQNDGKKMTMVHSLSSVRLKLSKNRACTFLCISSNICKLKNRLSEILMSAIDQKLVEHNADVCNVSTLLIKP